MDNKVLRNYSTNIILAGRCRILFWIKIVVHICGYSNRHSWIEEEVFMCSIVFNYLRNSCQITQLVLKKKWWKNKNLNNLKISYLRNKILLKIKMLNNQRRTIIVIIILVKRISRFNQQHNNNKTHNLPQLHSPQYLHLQQHLKQKK